MQNLKTPVALEISLLLGPLGGDIEWGSSPAAGEEQSAVLSQSCGGADADTSKAEDTDPQPPRRDASAGDVAEGRRVAAEGRRVGADAAPAPAKRSAPGGGDIEISPSADTRDFTGDSG
jgi:hypothetical protein